MNDQEKLEALTKCIKNVEIMRHYQIAYFKNRLTSDLQKAKAYERVVDKQIDELLHQEQAQEKQGTFLCP